MRHVGCMCSIQDRSLRFFFNNADNQNMIFVIIKLKIIFFFDNWEIIRLNIELGMTLSKKLYFFMIHREEKSYYLEEF